MRLLILSAILLLQGCDQLSPQIVQAQPPSDSLTKCGVLDDPITGSSPDSYITYIQNEYYQCAIRHNGIVAMWQDRG
jgi:hypothetical protein